MSTTAASPRISSRPRSADGGGAADVAELRSVSVALGTARILDDVSLRLRAGDVIGLVGPNGTGKTTLLRVLATLLPVTAGELNILGAQIFGPVPPPLRGRIAYLAHEAALHPSLSLVENLRLLGAGRNGAASEVGHVLEVVGLAGAGDRLVSRCSRGMVRRAEIARALLLRPDLLLLDEAHAALDAASADLVDVLLDEVRSGAGAAVV
ncbi:MAG: ATP-binding cassette domain-containing protein, partial [Nitriliruptorales bacterium]